MCLILFYTNWIPIDCGQNPANSWPIDPPKSQFRDATVPTKTDNSDWWFQAIRICHLRPVDETKKTTGTPKNGTRKSHQIDVDHLSCNKIQLQWVIWCPLHTSGAI